MDQDLTLYHYTDDQAPLTDGSAPERQRVELLHRVLVAGYGSRSPAGWEEISTSTADDGYLQHFTVRQPYGNGLYVRVERGKDIVAARDAENQGATEGDLIDTFRAGLDSDGHLPPDQERWMALANDRTFYLVYDRTGTGEPVTGDMTTPPAIWEGFADLDDLMATPERATGYMVGGASARTQFLARYGASSTDQEATDCSAAIEGPPGAHDPHYAAMVAPLANQISFISSDAAHKARLSGATVLDNRLLIDALVVRDGYGNIRGEAPNVRCTLTGFVWSVDGYSADDWPKLGDEVAVDGQSYRVGYAGANGDHIMGGPAAAILLFREG